MAGLLPKVGERPSDMAPKDLLKQLETSADRRCASARAPSSGYCYLAPPAVVLDAISICFRVISSYFHVLSTNFDALKASPGLKSA